MIECAPTFLLFPSLPPSLLPQTFPKLLDRVFEIIRQKNPSVENRKTKLVMKPPQVVKVGDKKTSFGNFTEICKL